MKADQSRKKVLVLQAWTTKRCLKIPSGFDGYIVWWKHLAKPNKVPTKGCLPRIKISDQNFVIGKT